MNLFELNNVTAGYGSTPILRDVSLNVEAGDIVSLIGRNGVGKTSLMKVAMGLLSPDVGKIKFDGANVTSMSADKRAKAGIGYVPQGRDVFPQMTVEENLQIGAEVGSNDREKLYDEVYEYFPRLSERKDQNAGTMSGGEQQMLAIGRALVGNPDLLLLDEPSEGVQPSIVTEISERIREINEEIGTTVLFVEQNIQFTISASNSCYVMEKGQIVDKLSKTELEDSSKVEEYITI
ncbi:ABC transporter ATP-binding protein [Halosegnis longus]|uniref:ABC transporter ATP-binding protein n=1 Tax=Halosegnis longus TaxID=2216012 RepID=A0AAJ4R5X1_9EURY|nr:ABC transporter ATP-binding protein [Salella cibi]